MGAVVRDSASGTARVPVAGVRAMVTAALVVTGPLLLVGCTSAPALDGVWSTSIGGTAVVDQDGACTGMYFADGRALDIGGPESCTLGSEGDDGTYPLVVRQAPNQATYRVRFGNDTMTFDSGGRTIVLTRQ